MLTVKYISDNGDELVIQASRILTTKNPDGSKQPTKVTIIEPSGRTEDFVSGTIYVMNDTGATVSQWMIIDTIKPKIAPDELEIKRKRGW